ncbi:hypothetical protein [Bradyrhizobium retamae]|uniref:hypothetical protein n=1 Tax=Bradyrhizobium retamae TaxID=1300035 RepID=UPI0012E3F736|nr:hypothetical protein [Bradyrhizobium retamae]
MNSDDPLADLGLDDTAAVTKPVTKPGTKPATKPAVEAPVEAAVEATNGDATEDNGRDEVEVGEIEFGFSEYIPTAKRKAEGSKYKFDALQAPQKKGDKTLYAHFRVKLQPGVDPDKLRRSVQSATTQANRQGAEAGKYFVSRTETKDGVFVGMIVYRTDDKPTK